MTNVEPERLPVDPYAWHQLPMNFALLAASWAALLAWLLGGSEGAGNLFMAWTWFCAVVYTIAAMAKPSRLHRGAPMWLRVFFRCSAFLQVGVLAWFGCWWLMAACLWSIVCTAAQRQHMDKQIAAQEAF